MQDSCGHLEARKENIFNAFRKFVGVYLLFCLVRSMGFWWGLHLLEVGAGWNAENIYVAPLYILDRHDCWLSMTFPVDS